MNLLYKALSGVAVQVHSELAVQHTLKWRVDFQGDWKACGFLYLELNGCWLCVHSCFYSASRRRWRRWRRKRPGRDSSWLKPTWHEWKLCWTTVAVRLWKATLAPCNLTSLGYSHTTIVLNYKQIGICCTNVFTVVISLICLPQCLSSANLISVSWINGDR